MFAKAAIVLSALAAAVSAQGGMPLPGNGTTVTAVVTAFTTYCPEPTTLTFNDVTYTITSATTLTITDCPCTVTGHGPSWTPPVWTCPGGPGGCPHPTTPGGEMPPAATPTDHMCGGMPCPPMPDCGGEPCPPYATGAADINNAKSGLGFVAAAGLAALGVIAI